VSRRTIEDWVRRGWLKPVPGSHLMLGHNLYAGWDLTEAERKAKRGRALRKRRSLRDAL